jgi:hypothetical protein
MKKKNTKPFYANYELVAKITEGLGVYYHSGKDPIDGDPFEVLHLIDTYREVSVDYLVCRQDKRKEFEKIGRNPIKWAERCLSYRIEEYEKEQDALESGLEETEICLSSLRAYWIQLMKEQK